MAHTNLPVRPLSAHKLDILQSKHDTILDFSADLFFAVGGVHVLVDHTLVLLLLLFFVRDHSEVVSMAIFYQTQLRLQDFLGLRIFAKILASPDLLHEVVASEVFHPRFCYIFFLLEQAVRVFVQVKRRIIDDGALESYTGFFGLSRSWDLMRLDLD